MFLIKKYSCFLKNIYCVYKKSFIYFYFYFQAGLTNLKDVVFKGNPFALVDGNIAKPSDKDKSEIFPEIKKRIPSVQIIDGDLILSE